MPPGDLSSIGKPQRAGHRWSGIHVDTFAIVRSRYRIAFLVFEMPVKSLPAHTRRGTDRRDRDLVVRRRGQ